MAKKKPKIRLPQATPAVTGGTISNYAKKEALIVYVDQLVQKELNSKKKQRRFDKSEYKKVHLKLLAIGINWVSLNALKFCVLRVFNRATKYTSLPPPPGVESSNSNTSSNK